MLFRSPWGALAGAGIGAAAGAFFSTRNKKKFQKKAEELADTIGEGLFDRLEDASTSTIQTLRDEMEDLLSDEEALRKMAKERGADYDTLVISLQNVNDELEILADERLARLTDNLNRLSSATDMSSGDIEDLAERMQVDFGDATLSVLEMMNKLALNVVPTTHGEWRGITEGALGVALMDKSTLGKRITSDTFKDQSQAAYDIVFSEQEEFGVASDQAMLDFAMALFNEGQHMDWLGMGPAGYMEAVLGNTDLYGLSGQTHAVLSGLGLEAVGLMEQGLRESPEYLALESRLNAIAGPNGSNAAGVALLESQYEIGRASCRERV